MFKTLPSKRNHSHASVGIGTDSDDLAFLKVVNNQHEFRIYDVDGWNDFYEEYASKEDFAEGYLLSSSIDFPEDATSDASIVSLVRRVFA